MTLKLISDVETNGLLDTLDRVHCAVLKDPDTGKAYGFADQPKYRPITDALEMMEKADELIFHNGIKFDIPALQKVYPRFKPKAKITDTLVISRLIWTDRATEDSRLAKQGKLPGRLVGAHSLESWGYRLGIMKGEYGKDANGNSLEGIWDHWNPEMQEYMMQDGEVTDAFYKLIQKQNYSQQAIDLEHEFCTIIAAMERHGIGFNVKAAQELYQILVKERLSLARELAEAFPPKVVETPFTPKRPNKKLGYTGRWVEYFDEDTQQKERYFKGDTFIKTKTVEFNPSSRQMIGNRLKEMGWEPAEFTPSGEPKIDEKILSKLPYPQAQVLARHFLIEKRIGQIAEGDQAWLRLEKKGRIYASVNTNGTPTGRCTHSRPNITQVPKVGSAFGAECRSLFLASTSKFALVGVDLAGIELRCLAHYMARYDGGEYAKAVVEGREEFGTDVHSVNAKALGLEPKQIYIVDGKRTTGRNLAKTFIYAFLYGAGDEKLGSILGVTEEEMTGFRQTKAKEWVRIRDRFLKAGRDGNDVYGIARTIKGGIIRDRFMKTLPALGKLVEAVKKKAKAQGYLIGLDGRRIHVRSSHSALNSLLQCAGAVIAKQATVFAYQNISTRGYKWGSDWALVIHAHDELQNECREELADEIGQIIVASMQQCTDYFSFRVPIDGTAKAGKTWCDTH